MLTPSSNTIREPVTTAMIAGLPELTAPFSRFKVTEIALSGPALAPFDDSEILRAELLAHAKVDVIAWNGAARSRPQSPTRSPSCAPTGAARRCRHAAREGGRIFEV